MAGGMFYFRCYHSVCFLNIPVNWFISGIIATVQSLRSLVWKISLRTIIVLVVQHIFRSTFADKKVDA